MGLFSNDYETKVGTSVSRVIEDKLLPHSLKTGSMKSLLSNDEQLVENVMEDLLSGIGVRAGNAYRYGRDHYMFGLPSSTVHNSLSGQATVQAIIEGELGGTPITINYYHLTTLNMLHVGWVKLIAEHGFNRTTNILGNLTTEKGKPVYLVNATVMVTPATLAKLSAAGLAQWGDPATMGSAPGRDNQMLEVGALLPHTPWKVDSAAANDYIKVDYNWRPSGFQLSTGSFNLPITGYDLEKEYHQANYIHNGVLKYWLYEANSGGYPDLDDLFEPAAATNGEYFPWLYFRYGKVSGAADTNSEVFQHSKKLAKYFNIDYLAITEAIHENPDIADVEQAIMMMAVPANTANKHELRYLFDYFNVLYERTGGALRPTEARVSMSDRFRNPTTYSDGSIIIQDGRFKMGLSFHRLFKKKVVGNIGEVGTYAMISGIDTTVHTTEDTETQASYQWTSKIPYLIYRKQVTNALIEEIKITNLRMIYHIYGKYTTIGDGSDASLLVPIDRSITKTYPIPVQEVLYARSMHYIFNSRVVIKIKWYEQSWFRAVMIVAAIVITIITLGDTWELIVEAIALGATIETIVMMILTPILDALLVSYLIKIFVKIVGIEAAYILAIVAAVYGSYDAIEAGSLTGAPWAKELLQLSTGLSSAVNAELQNKFGQLQKEGVDFANEVESKEKKLKEANELLGTTNPLMPFVIFGEKPNDYYRRTVHSGNIGVLSLDAISMYVDGALTLPKLTDTL